MYETPFPEAPEMRFHRLRFTVRRMMVVVAIVAIALGGGLWGSKMIRLSRGYALDAQMNAGFENLWLQMAAQSVAQAEEMDKSPFDEPFNKEAPLLVRVIVKAKLGDFEASQRTLAAKFRGFAAREARKAAHHASLRRKYERASRYPWLSVEPNPPDPE
jgi:hypothetical protein